MTEIYWLLKHLERKKTVLNMFMCEPHHDLYWISIEIQMAW